MTPSARRSTTPSTPDSPDSARYYVRAAAEADLEAVLRVKATCWRQAYGHLRDESFFEAAEATLPQQLEHWRRGLHGEQSVWLAEDLRGRCVGLASSGPARPRPGAGPLPETELYALYVLAEAHGTGVADALLTAAVGPGDSVLSVLVANHRARAFYRRHGFADHGGPVPMTGPWAGEDDQLMVRRSVPTADREAGPETGPESEEPHRGA